jgi:predicted RNA-binding protein with RPS1 domain
LQDGFVKNVADVVKVGDTIKCRVLSVDVAGKRLALTRKGMGFGDAGGGGRRSAPQARVEEEQDQHQQQQGSSVCQWSNRRDSSKVSSCLR